MTPRRVAEKGRILRGPRGEGGLCRRADGLWACSVALPHPGGKRQRRVVYARDRAELQIKIRELAHQGPEAVAGGAGR